MNAYMKQLIVNGDGKFHVIKIGAETEEALNQKRDLYLADDWQEATEEEYNAQMASAAQEPAQESAPEAPKAEETPAEPSSESAPVETTPDAQG